MQKKTKQIIKLDNTFLELKKIKELKDRELKDREIKIKER